MFDPTSQLENIVIANILNKNVKNVMITKFQFLIFELFS